MADIALDLLPNGKWKTIFDEVYRTKIGTITVPVGYVTDLASVPRILWPLLPPFGRYAHAAVMHDWLYTTHRTRRKSADAALKEVMIQDGVSRWQVWVIYTAVRLFGGSHYER